MTLANIFVTTLLVLVNLATCHAEHQQRLDLDVAETSTNLFKLLEKACDASCCGPQNSTTSGSGGFPCCKSCDGLATAKRKLLGVQLSFPNDIRFVTSKSGHPRDEDAISIQELIAHSPLWECDPPDVVTGCYCNGYVGPCPCSSTNIRHQINELFKISLPKTFPPLVPILIQDEKGDYLFLEQDKNRKLITTQACLCKDGGFTSNCKDDCTITNSKQLIERDEL